MKSRKDRLHPAFLIRALAESRPDDLSDTYQDALASGPSWCHNIARGIKRLPEVDAILQRL